VNAQRELFRVWRHHAVSTDSPLPKLQAERDHRHHAIIEQVHADLKNGPVQRRNRATSPNLTPTTANKPDHRHSGNAERMGDSATPRISQTERRSTTHDHQPAQ
jgi:hypothetical protein